MNEVSLNKKYIYVHIQKKFRIAMIVKITNSTKLFLGKKGPYIKLFNEK